MKKIRYIALLFIFFSINVYGTGGAINQNSIIECNNVYYGSHGNPTHWHIVEKRDGKWVSKSGEVEIPSCYIKEVNETEKVTFSSCVDGDTAKFIINNEEKTVRFLAIDAPEIAHSGNPADKYGEEASQYTCNTLKNAKEIILEYDKNSDKEDKYGRVLAFVFADNVLLEKSLIERGYAKVYYIYGDYNYVDELREVETIAKNKKLGLWEEALPDTTSDDNKEDNKDNNLDDYSLYDLIVMIIKKLIALLFD